MYDEMEKEEARKQMIELIQDKVLDKNKIVKYAVKMLRREIYFRMNLAEQVQFFSRVWALYIAVLEAFFFLLGVFNVTSNISKWVWGAVNLGIILLYQLFKLLWIYVKMKKKIGGKENVAYEQEKDTLQWFLKEEYVVKGRFWFYGMLFWLIFLGVLFYSFDSWGNIPYFYPAVIIVFFYEKWIQYEWPTREVYYKKDFKMLEPDYRKTMFAMQSELKKIISENALLAYEADRDVAAHMTEEEAQQFLTGGTFEQDLLRGFYHRRPEILDRGKELMESALEVLKGHSVLFKTAFYKDVDYAFLMSVYLKLVRGQTVLMICSTKADLKEMLNWMRNEISEMNGMDWWSFDVYQSFHVPGQVVALYCIDFLNFYEDDGYAEFRDKLGLVFLQEPSEYIDLYREKVIELCFRQERAEDRCLVVSSGKLETLDIVNWGFRDNNIYRGQLWKPVRKVQVLYWKEGMYREELCENGRREAEWGIQAPLLRYLVQEFPSDKIVWVGGRTLPVWDILWVYKRYFDIDIGKQVIPEEYGYGLQLRDVAYVITEDFLGNYRKTAELFISRGAERTAVHVIVPGYLLRDYIKDHFNNGLLQEGITRKKVFSERNIVQSFFTKLLSDWVSVRELKEELCFAKKQELEQLFNTYLFGGKYRVNVESRFIEEECYHIIADEYIQKWIKRNVPLKFYSDFEGILADFATDLTYNTIYQKHLPGQQLVLGNKSYWFRGLIERDGNWLARIERNTHLIRNKTYYRQLREYTLKNVKVVTAETEYINHPMHIQWEYEEADIMVKTLSFVSMSSFMDVEHGTNFFCKNVPNRSYYCKRYIKISLEDTQDITAEDYAVWMKESFFTLCPEEVDYLAVCIEDYEKSVSISNLHLNKGRGNGNAKCVYIIEDRDRDSGIIQDIFEKQNRIMNMLEEYKQNGKLVIPNEFKCKIK